jgi:hypothetical protein
MARAYGARREMKDSGELESAHNPPGCSHVCVGPVQPPLTAVQAKPGETIKVLPKLIVLLAEPPTNTASANGPVRATETTPIICAPVASP